MFSFELALGLALIPLGIVVFLPVIWGIKAVTYYYRRTRNDSAMPAPCAKVAVICSLRGADPSLEACLQGLLQQDYADYQVHIVVDNERDPAWKRVHEILEKLSSAVRVTVNTLRHPCSKCSLKVCAQLQGISTLGDDIDVVAFLDADSIPAPYWLRSMVRPFADATVGATSGMRWFAPLDGGWGSVLRHVYNAASFPQMFVFHHPWGGSLAIRGELFHRFDMKKRWQHALCEDSASFALLHEKGLRLEFVPEATHFNCESISMEATLRFIQRQLLCVRLDHADWPRLFALNLLNSFAISAVAAVAMFAAWLGRWELAAISGGILGLYAVTWAATVYAAEHVMRRNHRLYGNQPPPIVHVGKMVLAMLFLQGLCTGYLVRAHFSKQTIWRGIQYIVRGPGDIFLKKYEPFLERKQPVASQESIM